MFEVWPVVAVLLLAVVVGLLFRLHAVEKRANQLYEALESFPGHYCLWGANDRMIAANKSYRDLHKDALKKNGKKCSYEDLIRHELRDIVEPEKLYLAVRDRVDAHRTGDGAKYDRKFHNGDWFRVTKRNLSDRTVAGFGIDITEIKQREQELEIAHQIAGLGTWRLDDYRRLTLSTSIRQLHGLDHDHSVTSLDQLWRFVPDADRAEMLKLAGRVREEGIEAEFSYRVHIDNRHERILDVAIRPDRHRSSAYAGIFAVVHDVTEQKRQESQLHQLAYYDPLTGLANRTLFKRVVIKHLKMAQESNSRAAMFLIDVDHFKTVNDTLGHEVGDELLMKISQRMMGCLRSKDFLARLGGDEFAVYLDGLDPSANVDLIAHRLNEAVSVPVDIDDIQVRTSLSIGIVSIPEDGQRFDTLMRNADLALYAVKADGRAGHGYFNPKMFEETRSRMNMSTALRDAIGKGELYLLYQPQISLETGKVIGFEALLRWQSPIFGNVPPSEFIPIAESSSLIGVIGSWVLKKACHDASRWHSGPQEGMRVSVNVSAAQFTQLDMVDEVRSAISIVDLPPESLCLELTESLFLDRNKTKARLMIEKIDKIGVQLAIDDFGTGYSSLAYLRDLPFDELKIDRTFVTGCHQDPMRKALLSGMIELGHGLGMSVVAEGIEEADEAALLAALGAEQAQGFFFARPTRWEELPEIVEKIERQTIECHLAGTAKQGSSDVRPKSTKAGQQPSVTQQGQRSRLECAIPKIDVQEIDDDRPGDGTIEIIDA